MPKWAPKAGDMVLYQYTPDRKVPALVEYVQPNGIYEICFCYKGSWQFTLATVGNGLEQIVSKDFPFAV